MVLHSPGCGRVGRRRTSFRKSHPFGGGSFCFPSNSLGPEPRVSHAHRAPTPAERPGRPPSGQFMSPRECSRVHLVPSRRRDAALRRERAHVDAAGLRGSAPRARVRSYLRQQPLAPRWQLSAVSRVSRAAESCHLGEVRPRAGTWARGRPPARRGRGRPGARRAADAAWAVPSPCDTAWAVPSPWDTAWAVPSPWDTAWAMPSPWDTARAVPSPCDDAVPARRRDGADRARRRPARTTTVRA